MSERHGQSDVRRDEVMRTLEQISEGNAFGERSRLRELLRYLVQEELDARGDKIKAYVIGTEVFGRGKDFDPSSDSIVRVEVNRLRQSLEYFYATHGSTAPVRIEIPKGTYRPTFVPLVTASSDPDRSARNHARPRPVSLLFGGAVAVAVILLAGFYFVRLSTQSAHPDPDSIRIAVHYADDLQATLPEYTISKSMVQDLRSAISRNPMVEVIGSDAAPIMAQTDFRIETDVQRIVDQIQFSIEVINSHSDTLIWSRSYAIDGKNNEKRQTIVEHVSRELRTRLLGATKEVLQGRDPATLSAHQLVVMATWVSGPAVNALEWEKERLALARRAVEKDPNYGPAYSVMADKLAYLAAVDATMSSDTALQEAKESWQRAMELAPLDANVVFNVAQGQWHSGHVDQTVRSMERVVQLDPTHALASFLALVYPYTCSVASDEVMLEVQTFDRRLAADDPIRWITLTWIGKLHMSRGEYARALDAEIRADQIFRSPYTTVRHAALLNLLEGPLAAFDLLESQRSSWPNIDPAHFAEVTLPRQCMEAEDSNSILHPYRELALSIKQFSR